MAKQFIKIEVEAGGVKRLKNAPRRMKKGARKGVRLGMKMLREEARKFDGVNIPKIRTGNLRDSISYEIKESGDEIVGFLGSDALYAKIQEFGGVITASRAKYLVFKTSQGWRKVTQVKIPPRPFLKPAIESHKDMFEDIVQREILRGWKSRGMF